MRVLYAIENIVLGYLAYRGCVAMYQSRRARRASPAPVDDFAAWTDELRDPKAVSVCKRCGCLCIARGDGSVFWNLPPDWQSNVERRVEGHDWPKENAA